MSSGCAENTAKKTVDDTTKNYKEGDACTGTYMKCDGASDYLYCHPAQGKIVKESCGTGKVCDADKNQCTTPQSGSSCTGNTKMCSGKKPQVCEGGRYKLLEECSYGCKDGECEKEPDKHEGDSCSSGWAACSGDDRLYCENSTVKKETCPNGCNNKKCIEAEDLNDGDACPKSNFKGCDGKHLVYCEGDVITSQECPADCDASKKECSQYSDKKEGESCPSTTYSECKSATSRIYCDTIENKLAIENCSSCEGGQCDGGGITWTEGAECNSVILKKCLNDTDLLWCDMDAGGVFKKRTCRGVCDNLECKEYTDNSCTNPYVMTISSPAQGNTFANSNYGMPNGCSLNPQMGVVKFTTDAGFYEIAIDSQSRDWGNVLSDSCDPSKAIDMNCSIDSSSNDKYKIYLENGDHYLFVGPSKLLASHFNFTASYSAVNHETEDLCKFKESKYKIVSFDSNGQYTDTASTESGNSNTNVAEVRHGCSETTYIGKEMAYLFSISKANTKIHAEISVTHKEGGENVDGIASGGVAALYFKHCDDSNKDSLYKLVNYTSLPSYACTSSAESKKTYSIETTFDKEGVYLLFVDSVSGKEYDYTLTITRTEP